MKPDSQETTFEVTLNAGESDRKAAVLLVENHQSKAPATSSNDSDGIKKQTVVVDNSPEKPVEVGGQKGPEPTRYGDWEKAGRCTDF